MRNSIFRFRRGENKRARIPRRICAFVGLVSNLRKERPLGSNRDSPVAAVMNVDRYDVGLILHKIEQSLELMGPEPPVRAARRLLRL